MVSKMQTPKEESSNQAPIKFNRETAGYVCPTEVGQHAGALGPLSPWFPELRASSIQS